MHGEGALNLEEDPGRARMAVAALVLTLVTAVFALGLSGPLPSTADAGVPSNFKRHQEQYWVWYAPGDWIAASGKNDLNISSPTGKLWNKYGAGGVVCPNTADDWFRYIRNNYRDTAKAGSGIYSRPLFGTHFTKVGKTVQDQQYFWHQIVKWAGKRGNGKVVRGEMGMTIQYDPYSGACVQTLQTRGAPAKGNAASIKLLRTVQRTITQRNLSL